MAIDRDLLPDRLRFWCELSWQAGLIYRQDPSDKHWAQYKRCNDQFRAAIQDWDRVDEIDKMTGKMEGD